jgi:hypothetical protein
MPLSCKDIQHRKGGVKRPHGDLRHSLGGIQKPNSLPNNSRVFNLTDITLLLRLLIACQEITVVDGSNASAKREHGTKRTTVVVVGKMHLRRYDHLFENPGVYFLVVPLPKDEDAAIQTLLQGIKTGKTVYLVTGDTKPDPIMYGALDAAKRGVNVIVFSRHQNVPTREFVLATHAVMHNQAKEAPYAGSLEFYGVSANTPMANN